MARIFDALVRAVAVPVTVKIRTGPDPIAAQRHAHRRNWPSARDFRPSPCTAARAPTASWANAEYETIRAVKATVRIPVIANGDVTTAATGARRCLEATGADAVMIGRAALGSPWIFREVNSFLDTKKFPPALLRTSITAIILKHLESLYAFYGEYSGVRMARKHLSRYCDVDTETRAARAALLGAEDSASQFELAERVFGDWAATADCEELKR